MKRQYLRLVELRRIGGYGLAYTGADILTIEFITKAYTVMHKPLKLKLKWLLNFTT